MTEIEKDTNHFTKDDVNLELVEGNHQNEHSLLKTAYKGYPQY